MGSPPSSTETSECPNTCACGQHSTHPHTHTHKQYNSQCQATKLALRGGYRIFERREGGGLQYKKRGGGWCPLWAQYEVCGVGVEGLRGGGAVPSRKGGGSLYERGGCNPQTPHPLDQPLALLSCFLSISEI